MTSYFERLTAFIIIFALVGSYLGPSVVRGVLIELQYAGEPSVAAVGGTFTLAEVTKKAITPVTINLKIQRRMQLSSISLSQQAPEYLSKLCAYYL